MTRGRHREPGGRGRLRAQPARPDNPHGNAWETVSTVLASEAGAARDTDAARARYWKVESTEQVSALGAPTAYALMPGANVPPMYSPDALYAPRSGFTEHQLWVTAHDRDPALRGGRLPEPAPGRPGPADLREPDRPLEGRTWWSGTRSARTTWCARRTGR